MLFPHKSLTNRNKKKYKSLLSSCRSMTLWWPEAWLMTAAWRAKVAQQTCLGVVSWFLGLPPAQTRCVYVVQIAMGKWRVCLDFLDFLFHFRLFLCVYDLLYGGRVVCFSYFHSLFCFSVLPSFLYFFFFFLFLTVSPSLQLLICICTIYLSFLFALLFFIQIQNECPSGTKVHVGIAYYPNPSLM